MSGTTQSDRMILDFSAHLHPSMPEKLKGKIPVLGTLDETQGPIYKDIDAAKERWEAAGLSGAVLSNAFFFGHDDLAATKAGNDELLSIVEDNEGYYGLAAIPTGVGGEAAAEEFDRCIENGFHGGAIETMSHGIRAYDEELNPVFEVADRTGAPVFIHPKINHSIAPGVFDDTYLVNNIFGREVALAESAYSLIQRGFFDRYPNLRIVVHHMAGNIASMFGRMRGKLREDRFYGDQQDPDVELKPYTEFREQLRKHVHLDICGFDGDVNVYRTALDVFPTERIVFGTDYPYETRTAEDYQALINSIEEVTTPEQAKAIFGENTLNLLVNV